MAGYDFCNADRLSFNVNGRCCDGLIQDLDYCVNNYEWCTIEVEGYAKYFYCDRTDANVCGSQQIFIQSEVQNQPGTVERWEVCEFVFTTTEAVAATNSAEQAEAFQDSQAQVKVVSDTADDSQLLIFTIDQYKVGRKYLLGEVIDLDFRYTLLVVSGVNSNLAFTLQHGRDVTSTDPDAASSDDSDSSDGSNSHSFILSTSLFWVLCLLINYF